TTCFRPRESRSRPRCSSSTTIASENSLRPGPQPPSSTPPLTPAPRPTSPATSADPPFRDRPFLYRAAESSARPQRGPTPRVYCPRSVRLELAGLSLRGPPESPRSYACSPGGRGVATLERGAGFSLPDRCPSRIQRKRDR